MQPTAPRSSFALTPAGVLQLGTGLACIVGVYFLICLRHRRSISSAHISANLDLKMVIMIRNDLGMVKEFVLVKGKGSSASVSCHS